MGFHTCTYDMCHQCGSFDIVSRAHIFISSDNTHTYTHSASRPTAAEKRQGAWKTDSDIQRERERGKDECAIIIITITKMSAADNAPNQ